MYYPIDEEAARLAFEAKFKDAYAIGSATSYYRDSVDDMLTVANRHKDVIKPCYYDKLDRMTERFARNAAALINKRNRLDMENPFPYTIDISPLQNKRRRDIIKCCKNLIQLEMDIRNFCDRKGVASNPWFDAASGY